MIGLQEGEVELHVVHMNIEEIPQFVDIKCAQPDLTEQGFRILPFTCNSQTRQNTKPLFL